MTHDSGASLRARPTIYNGIQMRSRLEARVAAALDNFGVTWAYEPVAFGARSGQYLPDFVIDGVLGQTRRLYLEVRPTHQACSGVVDRMSVILESDSAAGLGYVFPETFERGIITTRRPSTGNWLASAISRCPCGLLTVGNVGYVGEEQTLFVESRCPCGDIALRNIYASPFVLKLPAFEVTA